MFDILICTWNNINYLKLLLTSIKENSIFNHRILVHVNEGADGTIEFLKQENIKYTHSQENIGLCKGINSLTEHVINKFVCLIDDDMYVMPSWDYELLEFSKIHKLGYKEWISSIMIEPTPGPNTTISPLDYGRTYNTFDKSRLLNDFSKLYNSIPIINNLQSEPLLLTSQLWKEINGYDEDFGLGIGAEDGLAAKVWYAGGRNFVCIPKSLVYHFQCKTTSRQAAGGAQNRENQLRKKYNIDTNTLANTFIKRGQLWEKR